MLEAGGASWRIYQDIVGDSVSTPTAITNDQGSGPIPTNSSGQPVCNGSFVGTYTDNPVLYFQQYAYAPASSPLFQKAATGTALAYNTPALTAPRAAWESWAEGLFAEFQSDVKHGTLPQVSWLIAPYGYCEHPAAPNGYGAWYISQVLDILTSNPEVFSKTVFIVNYDENDGSFDHLPAPVPAISSGRIGRCHHGYRRLRTGAGGFGGGIPRAAAGLRLPCTVPRDLALEQGRLRELRIVGSHLGRQVHREALWGALPEHHALAPRSKQ